LTKNRFRFSEGKILVDLPPGVTGSKGAFPHLQALLEAL
jgi:hypothetical protein